MLIFKKILYGEGIKLYKEGELVEAFFFDLDRTLVRENITQRFLIQYFIKRPISFLQLVRLHWRLILKYHRHPRDLLLAHQLIAALIESNFDAVVFEAREFILKELHREIFIPIFIELKRAYHLGKKVVILSAAPHFIVEPIAKVLGPIDFHSTFYEGTYSGKLVVTQVLTGKEKKKIAEVYQKTFQLQRDQLSAYSDSIQDLELLSFVGSPVVVNPDSILKGIAIEENWRFIWVK